ncbi:MAG: hypothetical protein K6G85_04455, partial [Eubacterium sp.]|nr:hypothetical protein [Eubacterium sp.]
MLVQKEKNVVKIRFDDESYIITPSLKQWDKGQIIQFLDVDDGAIVQFGTNGNSYVQEGQVDIPDFLLEQEGQLLIYVRFIDENSETTVKKVIIPISPKDKPKDYIEPENEQSFIQQVTEIMNSTKAVADSVREDADNGDFDGYTPIKGTDYFTREEIEEIEDEAARKVDLSGLVPKTRMIGDETLAGDITKDKLGREVTKAFVAGGSWYGMLIPWLISQCGSKTQQDTNVAEIQSLKLTSGNKLALSIDT